ncbi:phage Gp37/Gp68 family protein [Achromobacter aloeverae]
MAENSTIEWTDHTFNPWEGCQKAGPGCEHCYAETRNARYGGGVAPNWGPGAPRRRTGAANWRKPLTWNRDAGAFYTLHRRRQRVFCASLADVFDNQVEDEWRLDLATLVTMTPNLDWLLLTKRIGNATRMLADMFPAGTPEHVWVGATICNQEEAERDIPKLLAVPARRRFLSMEPLLGPVGLDVLDLDGHSEIYPLRGTADCEDDDGTPGPDVPALDWVIVGGESGIGARPMHPDWVRSLRDQCVAAGVPFLFKQWGDWAPGGGDFGAGKFKTAAIAWDGRVARGGFRVTEYPPGSTSADGWSMVHRPGKGVAGRMLDCRVWNEVPQ